MGIEDKYLRVLAYFLYFRGWMWGTDETQQSEYFNAVVLKPYGFKKPVKLKKEKSRMTELPNFNFDIKGH